ncbi:5-amino-6-(D-ribitylamino)uracil--L-tyrosine 4-hydroxyphenyl transferase CofH (plasmid) [Paraburkholderia sprentiae WSM5005]|uniref:FO synthase n=1 Tax=Paraburkholderia sprentiae WSM5005 TaxID=754502 RepID=A0A1I9YWF6_9BURK|nr:5-amino-6-(D-ribitylamino)uracil--L-tyrosine 4-hydroxyphenyl transferase CofH [Paraburkholderia sprentiae]APA90503.1 5-amino-6-(D-ribitylamino)uracil--L-tyrosine 4-hydroxyphenyl transferase CofH [Paraburkholderia sprentiae WSM5005]
MILSSFDDPQAIARQLNQRPRLELFDAAESLTLAGHGARVTYSRKVFIPLTKLCRDVCHYCTFAETPGKARRAYLSRDEILQIARAGVETGCREALFTLGDNPEARYPAARAELDELGHPTTLSYLAEVARLVMIETGLLPHLNPGLMGAEDYRALRPHSASMGIMLESASERLCLKGGPHYGSPDKEPARRIASIAEAGKASVPFTTGLLIGIGETRLERIESLLAIRALHAQYGHIQEVIIQNFRAKPGTVMAGRPEPSLDEHLWTIAAARLILGAEMSIQAPPNLRRREELAALLRAGVNDWGGVSPVTPDHVNPEAPWPHLEILEQATTVAGRSLIQRLAIGPAYARNADKWTDPAVRPRVLRAIDARGLPITDGWAPGRGDALPELPAGAGTPALQPIIMKAMGGQRLDEAEIAVLFEADGDDLQALVSLADRLRQRDVGETITFVVNRNINYTNMCLYKCGFCAFAKGSTRALRGPAYRLDLEEIARRAAEAVDRGATEVCCQGGIHPDFTGQTYLDILAAIRKAAPSIHIHAFSPLEVTHGAQTLGLSLRDYLGRLKDAGLASLPGTAAEILHPDVRAKICPDKLSAEEWLEVMRTAHAVGLRSTATIMFGHVDTYAHWARHLELIRSLQEETGGFTEFVPLPFVHMESPMARKGQARSGPSYREAVLMHAISRIVLGLSIHNIQVSWVKMGAAGAAAILNAGANDMGGVLMDESITRAAGGQNGQMLAPDDMEAIAAKIARPAAQRTTFYQIIEHDGALDRA